MDLGTALILLFSSFVVDCQRKCLLDQRIKFNCNCERAGWQNLQPLCIPMKWRCDGVVDCPDASDEMECNCPKDTHQCSPCEHGGGCRVQENIMPVYFCDANCYFVYV